MFSKKDLETIEERGISPKDVEKQLEYFHSGFPSLDISEPAILENGILNPSEDELTHFIRKYEVSDSDVLKFVPASGAATRMFNDLYTFLEKLNTDKESSTSLISEEKSINDFFAGLDKFAFFNELDHLIQKQHGITAKEALKSDKHYIIIETLLFKQGMNYGSLPKGLLKFHKYKDRERTAAQEQLMEALEYAKKSGKSRIHFTTSSANKELFERHIKDSIDQIGNTSEVSATFSEQFPNTDTIAVAETFTPIRDENNSLLFRPSGHGALLSNLNELNADLIFIKNIDNVTLEYRRDIGTRYKKALAGILLEYQERVFDLLRQSSAGHSILKDGTELLEELGVRGDFSENEVIDLLDRPIRVCGMVRNEGEPGGGPFWVKGANYLSLQIVESAQVNKEDKVQLELFNSGTHFNPVDVVCGVKNFKGQKFDLLSFRDENLGFISTKSYNGGKLLAMELPGLWNGGMANWNTIFVEVPLETFNPVKSIIDLLKPAHC